jgi:hypothetical protein
MSLREAEVSRSHRAQRSHQKQVRRKRRQQKRRLRERRLALDTPLSLLLHEQVLTFFEWCQINRFSERTGRRILKSGQGPPVVRLSERRIGVRVGDNREWQASRARAR